ncbi:MAG: TonB-dependent receptor [Croceitalea sp.]|nr:TonB-dependent receptor [Croceitalea sp.]
MPGTIRSHLSIIFLILVFLCPISTSLAQEEPSVTLSGYLKQLENRFEIKFSYLNEDVMDIFIDPPSLGDLNDILSSISNQTQIQIKKLSDRYYSLAKNSMVDVCGKVLDNFEQNTVSGATIEVLGSNIALITDLDGSFELNQIPRNASLKIRYLGYVTRYIQVDELIGKGSCKTILLAQNYEKLDEVIVYDFLTAGITRQKDASITLNIPEFGILPGLTDPDILQSVQALPGIKSIDETVSDINVRGGTNDQNLILWNGIKMYQSGHFFGLISAFNPFLTDKVTIYKNGTPAQYGDGVSSVISMETTNDIDGFVIGGTGVNFISGDVYGQIPLRENLAFQFSARRSTTDFLNTPTFNKFSERAFQDSEVNNQQGQATGDDFARDDKFFFYDFTGKLLYDINEDHKIRLNVIGITNDLELQETNNDTDESTTSLLDQTNLSGGLQLQSQWTPNFTSHLNIYYSRYNLEALAISSNAQQQLAQNNRVIENAIKLNTVTSLTEKLDWQNGYQFIETGIRNFTNVSEPAFKSDIIGVIRIHAPYSQLDYTSFENKFIASAGLRLNYIENLGTFSKLLFEPRLNLNLRLANNLRGQLQGEFKSQSTNQIIDLEQNFLGIEKRRWILSDDDELPITQSKQASLGLNYEKNKLYIGLEGFYKKVEGISTRTQGFQNENQFNGEIGSYDIKGLEFLINKQGGNYSTWLSYTYNTNQYTFESTTPNTFPNNLDVRHSLTFASTYTLANLKLGIGLNYRSGKPYTEPQEGGNALNTIFFPTQINYKSPNSSRLPDYLRADASAIYKFQINRRVKASAGISLLNLTNRKNILNRYYRLNDDNEIETIENISLGLTPNVSIRLSF